jgi:pyruvate dehydrogenase E2 component (dihydrolipoamide acetyltransferase)
VADFLMPSLGADMDEGTLVEWQIKPGDTVKRGQVVAVIETAKGAIDVEIFQEGVVEALLVAAGATVPVGQPIAKLRGAGEVAAAGDAPAPEVAASAPEPPPAPRATPAAPSHEPAPHAVALRARASPAARRKAAELGVALEGIEGTGPDGAVAIADVEAAAARLKTAAATPATAPLPPQPAPAAPPPAATSPTPRSGPPDMRAIIAAAMAKSKREIPHYYLGNWVDLTAANEWLAHWNASHVVEQRLLPGVLMLRAVALALARFPEFNGFYKNDTFVPGAGVHIGTAISLRRGGLIAPAIRDVGSKSLPELMASFRDVVTRARAGRLTGSEIAGGTITISSLGEQGVEEVFPVIYAPQVAIVGFGTPLERPWVVEGRVEPRWLVRATLAADHRVSDGHRGALFLAAITRLLQEPDTL